MMSSPARRDDTGHPMERPAKETRQQMPSESWAVPTGHEAKRSCKGQTGRLSKTLSYPRVPLVPRSTRGYWLATTPWFVVESSA